MASSSSHALLLLSLISAVKAATFTLINNCPYTVWPAAVPAGGGRELIPRTNWTIAVAGANNSGRFWARTNCSFDGPSGKGSCLAGDCAGILNCTATASPPATLVEYSVYQYGDNDFYGISLVDGFNVPVEVRPYSIDGGGGGGNCSAVRCTANISGGCPTELRSAGGCDSACRVFKTNEYCCSNSSAPCEPTKYSSFFKNRCPQAYSYPQDDADSTFMCGSGADYAVTFCP